MVNHGYTCIAKVRQQAFILLSRVEVPDMRIYRERVVRESAVVLTVSIVSEEPGFARVARTRWDLDRTPELKPALGPL
jgi:hypothetical protein